MLTDKNKIRHKDGFHMTVWFNAALIERRRDSTAQRGGQHSRSFTRHSPSSVRLSMFKHSLNAKPHRPNDQTTASERHLRRSVRESRDAASKIHPPLQRVQRGPKSSANRRDVVGVRSPGKSLTSLLLFQVGSTVAVRVARTGGAN